METLVWHEATQYHADSSASTSAGGAFPPGGSHGALCAEWKAFRADPGTYGSKRIAVISHRMTNELRQLGQADQPTDPHRYVWKPVPGGDANVAPLAVRLLRTVAERQRWRAHMARLQAEADGQDLSATERTGRAA